MRVPRFGPADLGRRVSVRFVASDALGALGQPQFRDVVGTLIAADDDTWVVRRRDGQDVAVDPEAVVAARLVPAAPNRLRRAADIDTPSLERIAAAGWQPLEAEEMGGWLLRAAGGFTGRANSVLALGDPDRPWPQALDDVARWYRRRRLVPTVQVALPWGQALDERLAAAGWIAEHPVRVQVVDVASALMLVAVRDDLPPLELTDRPTPAWTSVYRYGSAPLPPVGEAVLANADEPVFVLASDPGPVPVAVGRGALTPGWLGITAIDVAAGARRRGLGGHVLRGLLAKASARGARFAYLQVADENVAAQALYARFGFVDHHRYHYRRLR